MPKRKSSEPSKKKLLQAKLFAAAYIKKNCNGVKAMQEMGQEGNYFSLSQRAYELLETTEVQDALADLWHAKAMSALESIERMCAMARGSMDDFLGEDQRVNLLQAKERDLLHLVKKVKEKTTVYGGHKDPDDDRTVVEREVELYSALEANKIVLQIHGLLDRTLKRPKDERDLDRQLLEEFIRVHGEEKGRELGRRMELKVPGLLDPGKVH